MKKILTSILVVLTLMSSPAKAEYTFIIPQEVGGGTSVWASIVSKQLEQFLGEKIKLKHIPSVRDKGAFNDFHNKLQYDNKTVMVSNGANAESFLVENVDYDYSEYRHISSMNLSTTIVGHVGKPLENVRFPSGSGFNPDLIGLTVLACGNLPTISDYENCSKRKDIVLVKGMQSGERRMSFLKGELTHTRETPSAYIKFIEPLEKEGKTNVIYHGGVLDSNGNITVDPNAIGNGSLYEVFKQTHGEEPKNPLYDAYVLAKSYRDMLQKSLWVSKDNPNAEKLMNAIREMTHDPDAMKSIIDDSGDYQWVIGDDIKPIYNTLSNMKNNNEALGNLIYWQKTVYGVVTK